ncbi:DUF427 domain-containing protein [Paenibacillus marchantiae]|uniref:DUF427 domain-containing protein n=1 Tax=Paenibacillus marchantiae TaxID=3026433 RepID=UPI00237B8BF2|nr:DUF427 domain-containing protein [Paenibacillus marchantiae]WDQ30674.1 DUF427 domain-containing protein [Paenibacillus marchantiae]
MVNHLNSSIACSLRQEDKLMLKADLNPRRVHITFAGETIADSTRVITLHERGKLPVYYFPQVDVSQQFLVKTELQTHCPIKGDASYWTIQVGERISENVVWGYENPLKDIESIKGFVAFYWNKVDAWYEEEEQIFVHPRDPYKRVDAIQSSRHVQIVLDGIKLADSRRPMIVFETGVPVRYYLPIEDVDQNVLTANDKQTSCPYKGDASYWTAVLNGQTYENIVWSYLNPIPEIPKIAGSMSFYNEQVDVYVDGELQPKPKWYYSALEFFNETEVTVRRQ